MSAGVLAEMTKRMICRSRAASVGGSRAWRACSRSWPASSLKISGTSGREVVAVRLVRGFGPGLLTGLVGRGIADAEAETGRIALAGAADSTMVAEVAAEEATPAYEAPSLGRGARRRRLGVVCGPPEAASVRPVGSGARSPVGSMRRPKGEAEGAGLIMEVASL